MTEIGLRTGFCVGADVEESFVTAQANSRFASLCIYLGLHLVPSRSVGIVGISGKSFASSQKKTLISR
jgi:hypothetical protein